MEGYLGGLWKVMWIDSYVGRELRGWRVIQMKIREGLVFGTLIEISVMLFEPSFLGK